LKDNASSLSPQFWNLLSKGLAAQKESFSPEDKNLVETAVRDNPNLASLKSHFKAQDLF